ncbi:TonB-dependent siderophore receptor [Agarivorans sp. Z349TD_8]|uniref:TonB-dependent siderophore receptor n=1 Tax=Agarivorans sp. Z349TD_8 TaxID=3421434 RepID=UPI003D7E1BF3
MNLNGFYLLVFISTLSAPVVGAEPSPDEAGALGTMVVTASKQSAHAASSINVSSSVVDKYQLEDARVTQVEDLSRVLPGLKIEKSGSLLFPIVSLRGVSSAQDFYHPSVSIYVDGVPLLASDMLQVLNNVQSVEMLRGPQGTLYGQSAQGGIINIVTAKPGNRTQAFVAGGWASRHSNHGKIHVSAPIQKGLLYASVTLSRQDDNGDFTNPATGSDDLGGAASELGSMAFRLAPDDHPWEANLKISHSCTEASQDTYIDYDDIDNKTLSLLDGSPDPYLKRCSNSQSLAGTYTAADWQLMMLTAFQQQDYQRLFPNGSVIANMPEDWQQNVQEIRLATRGAKRTIDAVFGLYRQYTKQQLNLSYDLLSGPNYQTSDAQTTMQTIAAYSDLTWHVSERFNLGGGLRFSHERAKTSYAISQMGTPYNAQNSLQDNHLLGQLSSGYQLNQAWYLYSRIAQGYKAAGFNIIPTASSSAEPYEQETSINYELGSRYQAGPLQIQSAIFHTHTKDMQLYFGPLGGQTLSNAGTADATGIELSSSWQFNPIWTWDIDGTAVHAEFTDDSLLYAGNKVPFVPEFSGSTSLNGAIDGAYGMLTPRVALNVVGPHYFDGDNQLRQASYALTDLRLGWQANDKFNLSVYANNVFNRRYRTYAYSSGSSNYAQANVGRTIGIDLRYDIY